MRYVYPVVFMPSKDGEHYDGGYYAECVDIPIAAGGSNYKRAKKNAKYALARWLCRAEDNGTPIPPPTLMPRLFCFDALLATEFLVVDTSKYRQRICSHRKRWRVSVRHVKRPPECQIDAGDNLTVQ